MWKKVKIVLNIDYYYNDIRNVEHYINNSQ